MTEERVLYEPQTVTAPGETLADLLEEQNMTQTELAERMGRPLKTINQVINGKKAITPETAVQLERVFRVPADYWIKHEGEYRAYLARQQEEENYDDWFGWFDNMPINELKKIGMLPDLYNRGKNRPVLLRNLLQFFGVVSPDQWESIYGNMRTAYRRSMAESSDLYAVTAWLRMGELQAADMPCPRFDRHRFEAALSEIRALTVLPPEEFEPQLKQICAGAGVVLALVPMLPCARVSGAARWINGRPIIQLSLYGKKNDRFWFTFFHEAGHLLRHSHKLVFLDEKWNGADLGDIEAEANTFAAQWLIPSEHDLELPKLRSKADVIEFSNRVGIHPGIVVGRLQHDGIIEQSWMNDLKVTLAWNAEPDE